MYLGVILANTVEPLALLDDFSDFYNDARNISLSDKCMV